jgi:hypothetical protein
MQYRFPGAQNYGHAAGAYHLPCFLISFVSNALITSLTEIDLLVGWVAAPGQAILSGKFLVWHKANQ